jgi:hypothetical protein
MNAGRLHIHEYADRSARASEAVTAPELAALFADLPAPHPKLPGSPLGGTRRILVVVGAVVALAVAGLLAFATGRGGQDGPAPAPGPVAAPTPPPAPPAVRVAPSSGSVATPRESAVAGSAPLPGGVTVRRATDAVPITLRPSYGVDLDDDVSSNWSVGTGCCNRDVGFRSDGSALNIDNDHAVVTGSPDYETCANETAYSNESIERGSLQPGETICVRTGGGRFALITIVGASEQAVQFRATVWDPTIS